jgi:glycine cleavage system H protein
VNIPRELQYTKDHEWVKLVGKRATIGITDFAQSQLGDVVFVEVQAIGTKVKLGKAFSMIESVKVVSDIYAPFTGVIVEVNEPLADTPEIINQDPYGAGWIAVIELAEEAKLDELLNSTAYATMVEEEG